MGRVGCPLVLALVVAGLDVATKAWAERALALHEPVPVFGEAVRLTLGYNSGSAFGMFQDAGLPLLVLTTLMSVGLAGLLVAGPRVGVTPAVARALGSMLGGAAAVFMGLSRWLWGGEPDAAPARGRIPLLVYTLNMLFGIILSAAAGLWVPIVISTLLGVAPLVLGRTPPRRDGPLDLRARPADAAR